MSLILLQAASGRGEIAPLGFFPDNSSGVEIWPTERSAARTSLRATGVRGGGQATGICSLSGSMIASASISTSISGNHNRGI